MSTYFVVRSHVQSTARPGPEPRSTRTVTRGVVNRRRRSWLFWTPWPLRTTGTSPIVIDTRRGEKATPAAPAAERMRPQLGSPPARAVLTKGELAIERATRSAAVPLGAP